MIPASVCRRPQTSQIAQSTLHPPHGVAEVLEKPADQVEVSRVESGWKAWCGPTLDGEDGLPLGGINLSTRAGALPFVLQAARYCSPSDQQESTTFSEVERPGGG